MILRKIAVRLTAYGNLDFWMRKSLSDLKEWIEILDEEAGKGK